MIAVVIVPSAMLGVVEAFLKPTMCCVSPHRAYCLFATDGVNAEGRDYVFNGELLTGLQYFSSIDDAKQWVEQDVAQSNLAAKGGVS